MSPHHLDYMVSNYIYFINDFNLNTSVVEELKNTGSLYAIGSDSLVTAIQRYYQLCDRESFYNLTYGEDVNKIQEKFQGSWNDFKYLYAKQKADALK